MNFQSYLITDSCLVDEENNARNDALRVIQLLMRDRIPFQILTNQSLYTNEQLASLYQKKGFYDIQPEHFYTSLQAAIDILKARYASYKTFAYIGSDALRETLQRESFSLHFDHPDWLFIGTDRNATFEDYNDAVNLLKQGAEMISLDQETVSIGQPQDAIRVGTIVHMLEEASGKKALQIGLPNKLFLSRALLRADWLMEYTLLVGTSIQNELIGGINAKMKTALIASYFNDDMSLFQQTIHPDYMLEDLNGILR